ncbi:hypothetical protein [Paraburkholderia dilworthii]|uniref:Uncharacterized protein n=1 Tax=Paraburkholderia dilworthii TaxID=948106 RepID=A0ABW9D7K0_9BURK
MRAEGRLRLLGEGWIIRPGTKYSVVEVGDTTVNNLRVPQRLGSRLRVGEEVALGIYTLYWLKTLLVVATPDGRVHRWGAAWLVLQTLFFGALSLVAFAFVALSRHVPSLVWLGVALLVFVDAQVFNGWRILTTFAPLGRSSDARTTT